VGFEVARGRENVSLWGISGLGPIPISASSLAKSSEAGL
jgi:hypothetical protein